MAFLKKIFSRSDSAETPASPEAPQQTEALPTEDETVTSGGVFARLKSRLSRTSSALTQRIEALVPGKTTIDDEYLDELEEVFLSADVGVKTTMEIMDLVRENVGRSLKVPGDIQPFLRREIGRMISLPAKAETEPAKPHVILVIGVNGSGKTTTTGKLAHKFIGQGKKVVLAAADTFRAAAIEQLAMWAERTGAHIVKHQHGADPSAVAYDATKAALSRHADVLLIDTAGRLHTKSNLMDELSKIERVIGRDIPGAPHETWLVLDGTTGQNALNQARQFLQSVKITGFVLTKLDSTSKGGAIIGIIRELGVPVRYIGIGEGVEDLQEFDAESFVDAIFGVSPSAACEKEEKHV
ncbi:signal recognition particle-docking protein FtsY [Desulfurispirillum indicum]|uniref:Signal recognition particle receptor FtsY n=1 Tax=Desulfurispirillum indicum (strain ATCC BAA-1389 / DSM 22839 / S5) TaxID=653733 RepID=E6W0J8_DESIS|nr:signal recognition particle-docking protein FtsY [Desulfurispirillum indicum]ADU65250.1 signal recognition particle-docking protein FtsY [Desulfurispirillum indicum S5]UCZ57148.1 signal recognition particle-docking protein FtsY [Desulfurispirillum indicum]